MCSLETCRGFFAAYNDAMLPRHPVSHSACQIRWKGRDSPLPGSKPRLRFTVRKNEQDETLRRDIDNCE